MQLASMPTAPVAQLDRALDFGSGGRGFESLRVYNIIAKPAQTSTTTFQLSLSIVGDQ